ncbi:MAG TPA: DUF4249 family protein [Candidatus Krumholzibacteria bacterium]|nr:DUF4249 family protein [Candidatus Krumholzibacteria bacterium]
MKQIVAKALLAILALALLVGCEDRVVFNEEGVGLVVVDAQLIVDRPLPAIRVSRSLSPREPITPASAGERDAEVWVEDEDGTRVFYSGDRRRPGELLVPAGRYLPVDDEVLVRPDTRYDLFVRTALGEEVRATTTTPPAFEVEEWVALDFDLNVIETLRDFDDVGDSVYTVSTNRLRWGDSLLEARFARDPRVSAYQVALFSLDRGSDFAIEPDFFEEEDFAELEREGSSPMFEASEGTIRLPWFAVFFEGRYLIKVYSTDSNWNDFVNTTPSLSGGPGFGGNAGDGFDRPIFHVEGGIGLFGSAAVDSIGFFVLDDD